MSSGPLSVLKMGRVTAGHEVFTLSHPLIAAQSLFILQAPPGPLRHPAALLPRHPSPSLTAQTFQPWALLQPSPPWHWLPSIPCSESAPRPQHPHRAALLCAQLLEAETAGSSVSSTLPTLPEHLQWCRAQSRHSELFAQVKTMTEFSTAGKYMRMMCQRKSDYRVFQGQGFLWK